jgi:hypothetical protein
MSESTFDPAQALKIDLSRGQLSLMGSSGRVLVPTESLAELLAASTNEAISAFGAGIGTDIGRRILERLGSAIERATIELYLEHLGGELALSGLGSLSVERWGKALVLCLEGLGDSAGLESMVMSLIEAAIQRSLSRDVVVLRLAKTDGLLRLIVSGRHAKFQIEQWQAAGLSYGQILTNLHQNPLVEASSTRGES